MPKIFSRMLLVLTALIAAFVVLDFAPPAATAALVPQPFSVISWLHARTSTASASPKYAGTLTSTDAGSTNTLKVADALNATARVDCASPHCFKTGTTATLSANCAQDAVALPGSMTDAGGVATFPSGIRGYHVEMAGDRYIVARALDGGNPACTVQLEQFNPGGR